jgi:uncharacterized membrane protein
MSFIVGIATFFLLFIMGWFVLWVLFLAVMALKRARDEGRIKKADPPYYLGIVVLSIGYVVDCVMNILASVVFFEPPMETTVSARCKRHLNDEGFRGAIARWLCQNLLNPFDIGGHC